jgi:hypothetical protein
MPRIAPFVEAGEQFQHLIPFDGFDEGFSHAVFLFSGPGPPVGAGAAPEMLAACDYAVMEHTASTAVVPVSTIGFPRPTSRRL